MTHHRSSSRGAATPPSSFEGREPPLRSTTPPARSEAAAYGRMVLMFALGAAVATFGMKVSAGGAAYAPSASAAGTGDSAEPLSNDVLNAIDLLGSLDMDAYIPVVKEKRMTISYLAEQNVGSPQRGFKPYHWKRLVMEARHLTHEVAKETAQQAKGGVLPTLSFDDVAPKRGGAGGGIATDFEGEDVEDAAQQQQQQVGAREDEGVLEGLDVEAAGQVKSASSTKGKTAWGAKKASAGDDALAPVVSGNQGLSKSSLRELTKPTLVPRARLIKPAPAGGSSSSSSSSSTSRSSASAVQYLPLPSEEKTICGSLHRSNLLRDVFYEWKGGERKPVAGMNGAPVHCRDYAATENAPSVGKEYLQDPHPTVAAGRDRRFAKQAFSVDDVRLLRRSGVAEQLYLDHELKMLYCVVPKAGCTQYKAWLLNNAGLFKGGTVHDRSLYSGSRIQNAQFVSDDKLREALNDGEYFKFTVTRSPYTRSLATYLERFNKCEKQTRRTKGECDMWKRALVGPMGRSMPRDDMSYVDFLEVMKAAAVPEVDFRNAHWVSNVQVCGFDQISYDWMGHLEDSKDSELLYAFTGQPGFSRNKQSGLRHSEGTSSKIPHYYDEASKRLVEEIFKNTDVNRLGYVADGVVP